MVEGATALRLNLFFGADTRGSSFLATPGFGAESRWDSAGDGGGGSVGIWTECLVRKVMVAEGVLRVSHPISR